MKKYLLEKRFVFQNALEGGKVEGGAQKEQPDTNAGLDAAKQKAKRFLESHNLSADQKARVEAVLKKAEGTELGKMKAEEAKKTAEALVKQLETVLRTELTKSYEDLKKLLPDAQKDCYSSDEKARNQLDLAKKNYAELNMLIGRYKDLKAQNADPAMIAQVQDQIKTLYGTRLVKDENIYLTVDRPNAQSSLKRLRLIESRMWLFEDALGVNLNNPQRAVDQPDAENVQLPAYLPGTIEGRPKENIFGYIEKNAGISNKDLIGVHVDQGVDFE